MIAEITALCELKMAVVKEEEDEEEEEEEEEMEPIRATGVSRATFGVIESFVGTTKPYV